MSKRCRKVIDLASLTSFRRRFHIPVCPAGLLILVALLFLTPYFYFIPKPTLSAVLISAVVFLVDFDILKPLWRNSSAYKTWPVQ